MKQDLIARFDEAELRLEKVVCVALQPFLSFSDDAENMLDDLEDVISETDIGIKFDEFDYDALEDRAELLRTSGFTGLFVQIAHARDGWGLYETRWFYADTIEQAAKAAIAHQWTSEAIER